MVRGTSLCFTALPLFTGCSLPDYGMLTFVSLWGCPYLQYQTCWTESICCCLPHFVAVGSLDSLQCLSKLCASQVLCVGNTMVCRARTRFLTPSPYVSSQSTEHPCQVQGRALSLDISRLLLGHLDVLLWFPPSILQSQALGNKALAFASE